jgi:hypothetical protein
VNSAERGRMRFADDVNKLSLDSSAAYIKVSDVSIMPVSKDHPDIDNADRYRRPGAWQFYEIDKFVDYRSP